MVELGCAALGATRSIPSKRMLQSGLKAAWRTRQAPSEAKLDNEFYQERARHIRELADKADPFIRKRLLDLAGNYDSNCEAITSYNGHASQSAECPSRQ
jgi:hypothetical protein